MPNSTLHLEDNLGHFSLAVHRATEALDAIAAAS
jgi:hypothetical protein